MFLQQPFFIIGVEVHNKQQKKFWYCKPIYQKSPDGDTDNTSHSVSQLAPLTNGALYLQNMIAKQALKRCLRSLDCAGVYLGSCMQRTIASDSEITALPAG